MIILGCDNFGKELAKKMGAKFLLIEKRTFPDSEVCPRILNLRQEADNMKNETVIFANRMTLPLDPNRYLLETFLLIKTINALNPEKIGVVFPYLVYSRQDKVFRDGEPLSIKALFDFLHDVGATEFFTVSSHAERDRKMLTAPMPAYNINGFESIADYFFSKKDKLQNPIVIAPDIKSKTAAKIIADKIGTDFCVMEKHRDL
ncbi:ribose-phosphate pyrophosphokinase-like domain-containing protein, partial [Candidatus Woesearchaeota archaeon]|nr:ribose-phosphate pyrophosphokinase-like domain-containing protein [Candidatus Woesearchaeota archaeon]